MLLDNEALEYIKGRRAEGATYNDLEKEIEQLGYKSKTGGKLWHSQISHFACQNGLRKNVTSAVKRPRGVTSYDYGAIMARVNELKAEGLKMPKIAKKINREGFTTSTGLKFNNWRIRDFVRQAKPTKQTVTKSIEYVVVDRTHRKTPSMDTDLSVMTELINSNLTKQTKLALIEQMIK